MGRYQDFIADGSKSLAQPLLSLEESYDAKLQPQKRHTYLLWITHLLYLAVISSGLTVGWFKRSFTSSLDCIDRENTWSPALPAILPYQTLYFNGTLDWPSPFRGTPNPSLDAAWETLVRKESVEAFSISEEEFMRLGHPLTENVVRLDDSQGGGIFAGLEVYHQMHCLNLIREYTYPEYYQNRSLTFTDPPDLLRTHVDHCIEMLRQKIACDADVGVITHSWVSRRKTPWPNFNTLHKCRNYDGVVEWSEKHNAPRRPMRRPSNIVGLDPPP